MKDTIVVYQRAFSLSNEKQRNNIQVHLNSTTENTDD